VCRLLEAMARDRPGCGDLDDIHRAEPTLLDLIEHVADWSRDVPLLLLCLARQELLDARPAWGGGKLLGRRRRSFGPSPPHDPDPGASSCVPTRPEFQGEEAFRFRHQLIRDATYQAIPKEVRAELHERFAEWLSEKAGDRIAEYEEILGYHLEQAYRHRRELGHGAELTRGLASRASALLAAAGRRAHARQDWTAAAKLLHRTGTCSRIAPPSSWGYPIEHRLTVCSADSDFAGFSEVRWENPVRATR
jgi:hypothetical protein